MVLEAFENRLACTREDMYELAQKLYAKIDAIGAVMRAPVVVRTQCYDVPFDVRPLFGQRHDVMRLKEYSAAVHRETWLSAALTHTARPAEDCLPNVWGTWIDRADRFALFLRVGCGKLVYKRRFVIGRGLGCYGLNRLVAADHFE